MNTLNQFLFLPVVLAKLFRRTTLFLLEDPVEIGKVIKTALITNLATLKLTSSLKKLIN